MVNKYREVAVSEFFEKNKHLLGFDNPTKALLTVVKEGVDNSLTKDMPVVLEKNGRIMIQKIGEFIDKQVEKGEVEKLRNGKLQKMNISGIKTLCFDRKDFNLKFKEVSTLFRHKVNSDIYRIRLEGGRYVDLTDHHSVFTLKDDEITSIKTSELNKNDYLVVPNSAWDMELKTEINLLEELLKLSPEKTEKIGIYNIRKILPKLRPKIMEIIPEKKKYRIQDFKKCNRIPFNLIRKMNLNPELFKDCKIDFRFGKSKLPVKIQVGRELAEFLGLYAAEGSISGGHKVNLSFGAHEKKLINYAKNLFKEVWNLKPSLIKAHQTAINVTVNSTILALVLKKVFEVGEKARNKRIPNFIFNFPPELKESFIIAYAAGDGYPTKKIIPSLKGGDPISEINTERLILATSSKNLCYGISYLLSSIGIDCTFEKRAGKERCINGIETQFSDSYIIYLYTNQGISQINRMPFSLIENTTDYKLLHNINSGRQTQVLTSHALQLQAKENLTLTKIGKKLAEGGISLLRIKSIEKIDYDGEWVYDLSVPGEENFMAGFGPIACHNSLDASEEAGILPEIFVRVKNIQNDLYELTVEDNGPGIEKKYVKEVFGRLLFGSKFKSLGEEGIESRGQQGMGISASILYGQLTTGEAAKIESKVKNKVHYSCDLYIDTSKNVPVIENEKNLETTKEHGTKIVIKLKGSYRKTKGVEDYIKYTSVTNPHAQITYVDPEGKKHIFKRAAQKLPKMPKSIAPHPHGIELGTLIKMLARTKSKTLYNFLRNDFSKVGDTAARDILFSFQAKKAQLKPSMKPTEVTKQQAEMLWKAMQSANLQRPPTDCLSPIGEENLIKGLSKEYKADFVTACTRPVSVYRAIPFQVEVGLLYSSELPEEQTIDLIRYANKVPMMYQQSECAIYKAVVGTQWRRYGLNQSKGCLPIGPVILTVHIASVWVPFISEGKQAIAGYPEIIKEIKLGLSDVGRHLYRYISAQRKKYAKEKRAQIFTKYGTEVATALSELTNEDREKIDGWIKKIIEKQRL